ncbi:glycosyl transferase [Micromonospora sicca]|uniref:Glycosyl transferase n=1 Tax=Micromonospora sicca TaxID=2202420 RepID=A0A317D590_9ACTN|nr:glycosyltransferase [Micromonospora sp. 4G51]PWR07735.1 glycosyl transferase [Micromonospora sp. 4G51]
MILTNRRRHRHAPDRSGEHRSGLLGLRTGRFVCASLVTAVVCVLLVEAYANARFRPDHVREAEDQFSVPTAVLDGGPVLDARGDQPHSYRLPAKTIALTFDDGPDPVWTPRVLDVLRRHRAPATFFVIGSQVARHRDLARRAVAEGNELGVHTFTHPDVSLLPPWRQRMEYAQTQMAIVDAAGVRTSLLRFPYSSVPSAVDDANWPVIREAARLGYLTVVNDLDSEDWARPGVDAIVRNMTPADGAGAVVLLHDAGGDRSQTIAALDRFIPLMRARGYTFTTVSDGIDRAQQSTAALVGNAPSSTADRWQAAPVIWAIRLADLILRGLALLFVAVGILVLARTLLLLLLARRLARRRRVHRWPWGVVSAPVSVVVPAYNERAGIVATVRSLVASDHRDLEVIVVDDGSTDGTADLVDALGLDGVRVIRKLNGGKASALNTGFLYASHDIIVTVDADTVFEPDAIRRLIEPFTDPRIGAVAGNVKVANRRRLLGQWQHIEYVIGFNLDRRLYDVLGCMPTVPGAIGAFRRRALISAGGMSGDTLAEDTDITMAILRAGWRVVYQDRACAWTEAPASVSDLCRQRYRWSYGTMQAMWKHRGAMLDRGASGRFGRFGLPMLALFGVALPLLGPVLDLLAVYGLFFLDMKKTAVAWAAMLVVQTLTAAVAFRLDREPLRPLLALPIQQFAYRQLMYLVLARSVVTALTGTRLGWRKLKRAGDVADDHLLAAPQPTDVATGGRGGRDRWFDTLRALALGRVFAYHMFGAAWLSFAFPAMGVMFALGGSLMAASLDRSPKRAISSRFRRLLPGLWALGLVLLPLMIWHGWTSRPAWPALLSWLIPLVQPPGSQWAADVTGVLWYLVTYLWLVLLSPAMLALYRRWPVGSVLAPLAGVVLLQTAAPPASGPAESVLTDLATFGACWLVGFAHRDGRLRRLSLPYLLALVALCLGLAVGWLATHPEAGLDLNDVPVAQAFWSLGFVLLLVRADPPMTWLARIRPLDRLVTVLNSRALTIYLWHNAAITVCFAAGDLIGFWRVGQLGYLVVALMILTGLVLALGWVEDLSARRPPRLLPGRRPTGAISRGRAPRSAGRPAVGAQSDRRQQKVTAMR